MEQGTVRVLIAAGDALVREGLAAIFGAAAGVEVVGKEADASGAAERIHAAGPHVVVVALGGTRDERVRATALLAGVAPAARVVALIAAGEDAAPYLAAGAAGVIDRAASSAAIAAMARGAAEGLPTGAPAERPGDPDGLSIRESEVARLIARGYGNKDIAAQLRLSVKTVETYKARLMQKLGVATRAALVDRALQRGWLQAL